MLLNAQCWYRIIQKWNEPTVELLRYNGLRSIENAAMKIDAHRQRQRKRKTKRGKERQRNGRKRPNIYVCFWKMSANLKCRQELGSFEDQFFLLFCSSIEIGEKKTGIKMFLKAENYMYHSNFLGKENRRFIVSTHPGDRMVEPC